MEMRETEARHRRTDRAAPGARPRTTWRETLRTSVVVGVVVLAVALLDRLLPWQAVLALSLLASGLVIALTVRGGSRLERARAEELARHSIAVTTDGVSDEVRRAGLADAFALALGRRGRSPRRVAEALGERARSRGFALDEDVALRIARDVNGWTPFRQVIAGLRPSRRT